MTAFQRCNISRRRMARFGLYMMAFAAAMASLQAQTPPYAQMQSSTLTGSGNTISVTRLPVVTGTGTIYEDVTVQFDVAADGTLTITPGFPQILPSPSPIASKFKAGEYVGPSTILGGTATILVSGPSVGPGGTTEWTITTPPGAAPCTYPSSATWYVGSLASNPISARLKAVGITSPAYSYGIGGSQCNNDAQKWNTDTLIGLSQTGNSLTIYSYSYLGTEDSPTPLDQITYCLVGTAHCPAPQ